MTSTPAARSTTRFTAPQLATLLIVASFGSLALVSSMQGFLVRRVEGEAGGLGLALLFGTIQWIPWPLLAPGIVWLGRHLDFRHGRRVVSTLIHLAGIGVAFVVTSVPVTWLAYTIYTTRPYPGHLRTIRDLLSSGSRLTLVIFIYAAIIGLERAVHLWLALQERELQATRLEAQATRARLEALGARLQPHFLFNTLQSVSALVDSDPARARTMLAQLGDLLRDVLNDSDTGEVTLADEIALLGRYLDIEQTRFADRLQIEVLVAPEAAALRVPRFLLQPLAENALRHGLAPRAAGGTLRIEAWRDGDRLRLRVWNDGLPLAVSPIDGVGMATTRERLSTRYGAAATLRLASAAEGGVEAVVELPATSLPA